MSISRINNTLTLDFLDQILAKNGPDPEDYTVLNQYITRLDKDHKMGLLKSGKVEALKYQMENLLPKSSNLGWAQRKPLGYAGDHQVIDRMYRFQVSSNPKNCKWDIYFHRIQAAQAVRNRKTYFKNLLLRKTLLHSGTFRVLNLASGPARDILEFLQENPGADVHFTCVELDQRAIDFASELLDGYLDRVTFVQKNVFRYQTEQQFDLVWSAGLFDYFEDKVFVRLYRRLLSNVKPTGEIVIGNFHPRNESRPVMEILTDWYLHHRTEEQLAALAQEAGADLASLRVEQEPLGVNLFLRMAK
ncbi:MAG TPA: class I SAM-dependent methyltransferase [Saprospiraceae bacterium]|nr:class I SAM-dependent methyltransferase [Saprospiraceae bacterium]